MEKIEKNAFEKKIEELKTKENGILIFEFSTNEAYVTYKGKSVQCLSATLLLKFNDCTFSNNYLNNIPDDNTLKNTIILIDTSKSHNIKVYLYDIQKDLGFEIRNKKNLELNEFLPSYQSY